MRSNQIHHSANIIEADNVRIMFALRTSLPRKVQYLSFFRTNIQKNGTNNNSVEQIRKRFFYVKVKYSLNDYASTRNN